MSKKHWEGLVTATAPSQLLCGFRQKANKTGQLEPTWFRALGFRELLEPIHPPQAPQSSVRLWP